MKPIIGDLVDLELISYLKNFCFKKEQSILLNGTDNLLLNSFYETSLNYDLRSNYILKNLNFSKYNLIVLFNTNLRFENSLINAKLRQEYLWNNLLIYSFGAKYNLTYKYYQLGTTNIQFLKFIQGQHLLNNIIINKKYKSLMLFSSNLLHQYNNFYYKNCFEFLNKFIIN